MHELHHGPDGEVVDAEGHKPTIELIMTDVTKANGDVVRADIPKANADAPGAAAVKNEPSEILNGGASNAPAVQAEPAVQVANG
jgi:hypothetical protein